MSTATQAPKQLKPIRIPSAEIARLAKGHMLFAQAALEVMAPGGAITLTSSWRPSAPNGRNPAYESSKAPPVSRSGRAIARTGEEKGIRLQCDRAGILDSHARDATAGGADRALTVPFGRQGTGWEVAYAALFLISNESSYVNAHTLSSMPAIWRGSCGPNLQRRMAGDAVFAAMPNSPIIHLLGNRS